jgi:hypothetical protein
VPRPRAAIRPTGPCLLIKVLWPKAAASQLSVSVSRRQKGIRDELSSDIYYDAHARSW